MAYESTTVSVSSSQEQIRKVLRAHGVSRVTFGEGQVPSGEGDGYAAVEFVDDDMLVRVYAPIRRPDEDDVRARARAARQNQDKAVAASLENEERRIWRVLHWTIKARMEAVEEGLETFAQAFLPHIVDPATDRTLWERLQPVIDSGALRLGGTGLRALAAGS